MGTKKSRKKKKQPYPPLSLLDKSIYSIGLMISLLVPIVLMFCFFDTTARIAFRDPSVAAYEARWSGLFSLPFLFYVIVSGLAVFGGGLSDKKPIFGNRKIKYGERPWPNDCFPLFHPQKKYVYVSPSKKDRRRTGVKAWCIGFLVVLLMALPSFFGRNCLYQDNSVASYNCFNQKTGTTYTEEDFSQLTIRALWSTHWSRGTGITRTREYRMTIEMADAEEFTFSAIKGFRWQGTDVLTDSINKMAEIKTLFPPENITIKGKDKVGRLIDYYEMNETQAQAFRALFEVAE